MSGSLPFDAYLQDPFDAASTPSNSGSNHDGTSHDRSPLSYDDHRNLLLGLEPSAFCNSIQFQMPAFMMSGGPPLLAPGGGAEVLPPMFSAEGDYTGASSWFKSLSHGRPMDDSKYFNQDDTESSHQSSTPLPFSFPDIDPLRKSPPPLSSSGKSPATLPDGTSLPPTVQSSSIFAPSAHGLPVYSASGFDMLSILARVATRPHPKIVLGPVDLTCSFVVVDVRRYDSPIVYASPSFCQLTGYSESEAVGRNCRFLQAPDGRVACGDRRRYTASESVSHLKRSLSADKECQVSLINYRKGGAAFINLITVIPVPGGDSPEQSDEVAYHVGFQVDLTEQPNAILQKLRDGSYIVNYSSSAQMSVPAGLASRDRGTSSLSKELRQLLADPAFQKSLKLTTSTTAPASSTSITEKSEAMDEQQTLNLLLLEEGPDFVHVLSLKGYFLYVSPSVRNILGYEAEELVGKSITEFCHPSDIVPLIRELKESSAMPSSNTSSDMHVTPFGVPVQAVPKTVDLLFRARTKAGEYVWVECLGRLHVEPGKGRKAVVLSGRVRSMPRLPWEAVARTGGLVPPTVVHTQDPDAGDEHVEQEFWGILAREGTVLVAGAGVRDVLGWGAGEMIGRSVTEFVASPGDVAEALTSLRDGLLRASVGEVSEVVVLCEMTRRDGGAIPVQVVLYGAHGDMQAQAPSTRLERSRAPVVCQFKLASAAALTSGVAGRIVHAPSSNVFEELETARDTSWQYELQQLKFANRRLLEEIEALEAGATAPHQSAVAQQQQQQQQSLAPIKTRDLSPPASLMQHGQSHSAPPFSGPETHLGMTMSTLSAGGSYSLTPDDIGMHFGASGSSLGKRRWDARGDDGPT